MGLYFSTIEAELGGHPSFEAIRVTALQVVAAENLAG